MWSKKKARATTRAGNNAFEASQDFVILSVELNERKERWKNTNKKKKDYGI